jgi:hypothetical protein
VRWRSGYFGICRQIEMTMTMTVEGVRFKGNFKKGQMVQNLLLRKGKVKRSPRCGHEQKEKCQKWKG